MQKGDFIRISYVGRLETGEIFDLTDEETAKKEKIYNPNIKYGDLPIIVGARFLVKGLDDAVMNMHVGEKKDVEIKPEDAFGERNAELVRTVPMKVFKEQRMEPRPGMIVDFGGTKGRIQSVDAGRVRVDFNNPLAGHVVKYHVELKGKIDSHEDQVKSIMEFFGAKNAAAKVHGNEVTITMRMPDQLKESISSLVLEYVHGIEKVNFLETFEKPKKEDSHSEHVTGNENVAKHVEHSKK